MKDWEKKKLKNLCKIGDGNHSSKYPRSKEFLESGIPFIRSVNLVNGKVSGKDMKFISPEKHKTLKKGHLKTGDILFTNRGQIGKMAIVDENYNGANLNSQTAWLRCLKEVDNKFLYYYMSSPTTLKSVLGNTNGTALQQLTIGELSNITVPLPKLSEQQKIADILSTIDAKIEVINRQILETDKLKKGMMQRLLTTGIRHTEFKDSPLGKVPKSWVVSKFKDFGHVNPETLSTDTPGDYKFYYIDLSAVKYGNINVPEEKISGKSSPSRAQRIVRKGDILMATVRPNLLGYGFVSSDVKDWVCSTGFAVIRPKKENTGLFLYHYLYSSQLQHQVQKLIVGSNYPAINSSDVSNLLIPIPPMEEQEYIAESLTTIDDKREVLLRKRSQFSMLKIGLSQQLLNGRMRVNIPVEA